MNFEEFVKLKLRNHWIKEPGIEIYVRISLKSRSTDFDLANMNATHPGKGSLTTFLDKYEPQYSFFIENVQNPRLDGYLTRRGYVCVDALNNCYAKLPKESC